MTVGSLAYTVVPLLIGASIARMLYTTVVSRQSSHLILLSSGSGHGAV